MDELMNHFGLRIQENKRACESEHRGNTLVAIYHSVSLPGKEQVRMMALNYESMEA
jgi:hypothetical protein